MKWIFLKLRNFSADYFFGEHHIPRSGIKPYGDGWYVNYAGDLSTFDSDALTRLVFLAHDMCFRASVTPSGPGKIKIAIWKRDRIGRLSERHPNIYEALDTWQQRK